MLHRRRYYQTTYGFIQTEELIKYLFHIAFVFISLPLFGQETTTYLTKNEIEVGEKITLTYQFKYSGKEKPIFSSQQATLDNYKVAKTGVLKNASSQDVEILVPFKDTILKGQNENEWLGVYEITIWDSGQYIITAPSILWNDSTFYFPEISISSSLVKAQKGQDIYDIKEAFADVDDTAPGLKQFLKNNWIWIVIALIVLIGIIIFIRKRQKPIVQVPIKEINLKDRTLLAIDALEKAKLWEKGRIKEHHVELSFILRSYLTSRYEINLFEKTTKESQLLLTQKGLNPETVKVIATILSSSDMVKFAKSEPDEIAILKLSQLSRQIVAETSPIEFDHAE